MSTQLKSLYEAARWAELSNVEGRTFEQWEAAVSDYGLDDARRALESLRQSLEHSLATTFVELQDERNPEKRQRLWFECLRLGAEWKKLNDK